MNEDWVITTEIKIHGRNVVPDTELTMFNERGRFRFKRHVNTGKTEWIDVIGGRPGFEKWRSFGVENVKYVHYKQRTRKNLDEA